MDKRKRSRLEAKGWEVGDAADFLGLTKEEEEYIEMKLLLSESLRKRREQKKITQEELARLMHSSQSRVAKMEAGDSSVSIDLLIKGLVALGVTRSGIAKRIAR